MFICSYLNIQRDEEHFCCPATTTLSQTSDKMFKSVERPVQTTTCFHENEAKQLCMWLSSTQQHCFCFPKTQHFQICWRYGLVSQWCDTFIYSTLM